MRRSESQGPGPAPDGGPLSETVPGPVSAAPPGAAPMPAPTPASAAERALGHVSARGVEWPVRLLGCALALLVTDPPAWSGRSAADLVLPLLALAGALLAAAPLTARPVAVGFRWHARLLRHRNTAFVVGCLVLAAFDPPPGWLAACDAAVLLTYLLCVDAVTAGPPGARLLRRPLSLLTAYAATGLVLAAAFLPTTSAGPWSRLVAAVALGGAGIAVVAAMGAWRGGTDRR